jgi:hypothetical protein
MLKTKDGPRCHPTETSSQRIVGSRLTRILCNHHHETCYINAKWNHSSGLVCSDASKILSPTSLESCYLGSTSGNIRHIQKAIRAIRLSFDSFATGHTTIYRGEKTRQGALLQGASCVISLLRRPMTASSGPNKVTHLGARKAIGRGNRRRLGHAYYLKTA